MMEQKDDATIVVLTDRTGIRAKALYSIEALYYSLGALGFLIAFVYILPNVPLLAIGMLGASVICIIAFWRYFMRVTLKESIQINEDGIILSTISRGRSRVIGYDATFIENLRFVGFIKPIDHPMKSETFDYLGLQTQQEVVNAVTSEGNIAFEYGPDTIYFGRGVPSWDAAALNELLVRKTAGRLFIDGLPEEIPEEVWNK